MVKSGSSCCCCTLKFDVPAGLVTLEEDCGKSTGVMRPGAHWCYCCNKRVACMLTQNIITYKAPIKDCPTKDSANIGIDLYFTFKLPSDETNVKNFIYKLGAARFDELLTAEIDENIRGFINGIWLEDVYDLKGEMAKKMISDLNYKFAKFGIIFENCNVTNVHVSDALQKALQEKAKIKYDLSNHVKEQENKKILVENEQAQILTNLKKENERLMQDMKATITRANIDQEQRIVDATTAKDVIEIKAHEKGSVLLTKARGKADIAESKVKSEVINKTVGAKADAEALQKEVDQQAEVMAIEAESKNQASKASYAALLEEGKQEAKNIEAFTEQRRHNYEMEKGKVYQIMVRSQKNLVVSGGVGESLIQSMFKD